MRLSRRHISLPGPRPVVFDEIQLYLSVAPWPIDTRCVWMHFPSPPHSYSHLLGLGYNPDNMQRLNVTKVKAKELYCFNSPPIAPSILLLSPRRTTITSSITMEEAILLL